MVGEVVPDHQPVRIHDGVADVIADRDVAADLAVVGVHVVNREANLLEAIVDEPILAARNREDAVAAVAKGVVGHGDVRRIPQRYAVAFLGEAAFPQSFDDIAFDARAGRAVDIDPEQIAFEAVAVDHGPFGGLLQEHAGIHRLKAAAGALDRHAANGNARGGYGDHIADAGAIKHRTRLPDQRQRPVDPDP